MELLTAKKGTPHFTSEYFRTILTAVCGTRSYIAELDEQLEPELTANNTIKIRPGLLIHHGGVFWVKPGTYDQVTYGNGEPDKKRIDLVVARYMKDGETGIENCEWVVIKGEQDEEEPMVPEHTEGDMQAGDLVDDCPMFELHFDGLNLVTIKKLVDVFPNMNNHENFSNPNLLINGDFQVWQRGDSFNHKTGNFSCADKWVIQNSTSNNLYVYKASNGLGISSVEGDVFVSQPLEDSFFKAYAGKKYVLTKCIDGVETIEKGVIPDTNANLVNIKVSTDCTINYVKLELGIASTPFIPKTYNEELEMCQKYYRPLFENYDNTLIGVVSMVGEDGAVVDFSIPQISNMLPSRTVEFNSDRVLLYLYHQGSECEESSYYATIKQDNHILSVGVGETNLSLRPMDVVVARFIIDYEEDQPIVTASE